MQRNEMHFSEPSHQMHLQSAKKIMFDKLLLIYMRVYDTTPTWTMDKMLNSIFVRGQNDFHLIEIFF